LGNAHDTIVTLKKNPLRWRRHGAPKCHQIGGACDIRTLQKELMKGWIAGKAKIEEATLLCSVAQGKPTLRRTGITICGLTYHL